MTSYVLNASRAEPTKIGKHEDKHEWRPKDAGPDWRPEASEFVQQCLYEMVHVFSGLADEYGLRYTHAGGSLIGFFRNDPPGLVAFDHDVDIYLPAKDAYKLA